MQDHVGAFQSAPVTATPSFDLFLRPLVTELPPPDISDLPTDEDVGVLYVLDVRDLLAPKTVADVRNSHDAKHLTGLPPLFFDFCDDLPLDWKEYLGTVLKVTGAGDYLAPIIEKSAGYRFCLHVHYYYNRPLGRINVHHDSIGRTLFVGLHYLVNKPILGAEWAFHWKEFEDRESPLNPDLQVWPQTIREDIETARSKLADSKRWHAAKIPPNGLLFFTDELIHHKTPSRSRKSLDPKDVQLLNEAFTKVETVNAKAIKKLVVSYDTSDYERDISDDESDNFQIAKANTFKPDSTRSFMRFWITVQPNSEPIYW